MAPHSDEADQNLVPFEIARGCVRAERAGQVEAGRKKLAWRCKADGCELAPELEQVDRPLQYRSPEGVFDLAESCFLRKAPLPRQPKVRHLLVPGY